MKKVVAIFFIFVCGILTGQAQPNGGFENWHTEFSSQVPDSWQTFNFLTITFPPNPLSVFKTSGIDKHSGNYGLKLETVYINNNPAPGTIDDTIGRIFTGKITISPPSIHYGFPYSGRPEMLEFWCKYVPVGMDTAGAAVILRRWNGNGNDTIASGIAIIKATASYTLFQMGLTYLSTALPDSAIIAFASSKRASQARVGSTLYLDDVAFTGWVGIEKNDLFSDKIKIFPNPATDEINIFAQIEEAKSVKIVDALGKNIAEYKIQNYNATVNTSILPEGIYFYEIADGKNKILTRGKFNVVK